MFELLQVALREHGGWSEPNEVIPPPEELSPRFDVARAGVEVIHANQVAIELGFYLGLLRVHDEELIAETSGTFRLLYEADLSRGDFEAVKRLGIQAIHQGWPYWRAHVERIMTEMGLVPVFLSPSVPPGVVGKVVQHLQAG